MKKLVLAYLKKQRKEGVTTKDLHYHVVKKMLGSGMRAANEVREKYVQDKLYDIYDGLRGEGEIWFYGQKKVWLLCNDNKKNVQRLSKHKKEKDVYIYDVTPKTRVYLEKAHNLTGRWKFIKSEDIYKWLHFFLSDSGRDPDRFERFCCCLLEYYNIEDVKITQKKAVSGTDGGVDGIGSDNIGGEIHQIAFEAKAHNPNRQIGDDIVAKFAGHLQHKLRLKYGFIITTATFSKKSKVFAANADGLQIKLMDQDEIIELMQPPKVGSIDFEKRKKRYPNGLGLFKSPDYGLFYLNEDVLFNAISKQRPEISIHGDL